MSADATLWSSEAWASAPDAYLLQMTREGSAEAFGELWRRHLPAAYAVAHRNRARSAPEDVVAEAAARVLALIREGRGPDENFRAYFLSAVRTVAIDAGRRDLRLVPTEPEDLEELAPAADDPFAGLARDEESLALVREAFAQLPERDQRVLWHTTVEGAAPRAVAPALGMTANAVSVRAMRARESLRALYLDARAERGLMHADSDECRWTIGHLGAFVRGRLPKRQTERARAHVEGCPHAAAIAAELRLVHDGFPALLVPLVLAAGLGTPGFVSGVVALGSVGSAGAAGATGATGASGVGGAAGAGSAPAPSGSSSASASATVSSASVSSVSSASSASSASSPSAGLQVLDAAAQVASRVTGLVAAVAVSAGVAGALDLGADVPPVAVARPPAVAPSVVPTPGAPGSPAVARSRPGATVSASALPSMVRPVPSATTAGTPRPSSAPTSPRAGVPQVGPDPAPSEPSASPAPPASTPPTPEAPTAPTTKPPVPPSSEPPAGTAPTVTVRLVAEGDPARISVKVRSDVPGTMTIRISNVSGTGTLTVRNSSWSCTETTRTSVTCTGERGSALLSQAGTGGVEALVVRVTDAAGDTWTETIRPS